MRSKLGSLGWIFVVATVVLATFPSPLWATWSIIAVDASTGRVVIASATCVSQQRLEGFPSKGLMDIQAIVVPGVGVAAAQAGVDATRSNQMLIYQQLKQGTHPDQILEMLKEDPAIERRQFEIVDMQGRWAEFSGERNGEAFYLNVTDQNIQPTENANPVITLRMRYEVWKREEGPA